VTTPRIPAIVDGTPRETDLPVGRGIAVANESVRKELGVLPDETRDVLCEKLRLVMGL
jgi:hypothetical protein